MTTDTLKITVIASAMAASLIAMSAGMVEARDRGFGAEGMDFSTLDVDGSGEITQEDIDALRENRFSDLDSNGDGAVSRDEFIAATAERAGERAGRMFDRLDADGDGALSRDALEARGGKGRGANRMLERADTDNSGGVSEEEFAAVKERLAERGGKRGDGGRR